MTEKQREDLDTICYFRPNLGKDILITEQDEKDFLEYSERGLHKERITFGRVEDGLNLLIQGKRWRGIHCHELYEPGILDGSMPYSVIFENTPNSVIRFMAKEMFKGADERVILTFLKI